MNSKIVISVCEYLSTTMRHASKSGGLPDLIECTPGDPYFNSGVLLTDVDGWRKEDIKERSIRMLSKHPDKLSIDGQNSLNKTLYVKWSKLNPKRNNQMNWKMEEYKINPENRYPNYNCLEGISEERDIIENQKIIHEGAIDARPGGRGSLL